MLDDFESPLDTALRNPDRVPAVTGIPTSVPFVVRRYLFDRFRYAIYAAYLEHELVLLAVAHHLVGGKTISYTGDSEWTDELAHVGRDADLLIAECYYFQKSVKWHLNYSDVAAHRADFGARRMILTHMSREMLAHAKDIPEECAHDGLTHALSVSEDVAVFAPPRLRSSFGWDLPNLIAGKACAHFEYAADGFDKTLKRAEGPIILLFKLGHGRLLDPHGAGHNGLRHATAFPQLLEWIGGFLGSLSGLE
jgi:hypothetical protein